jgi:protein-S-isoprenylcysteine O-methyltransferase Ste14
MHKLSPPTYFFGAVILAVLLHLVLPWRPLLFFPWRLFGLIPLGAGIAFNLIADRDMKRHATPVKPFEPAARLLTGGVFAISRNPMYLGMALILLGLAVLLGTVTPFLPALALPILLDRVFIEPEERMLEEQFGERFLRYSDKVSRWL